MNANNELLKFACTLLFQFRRNDKIQKKRLCEERIFQIYALNEEDAYAQAVKIGKREQVDFKYETHEEFYEFIGIIELVELTVENDEIWSRYKEIISPMERKERIIPPKEKLNVFTRLKRFAQQ